mgnify:CR=1 FL=1
MQNKQVMINELKEIATKYRQAIEKAIQAGEIDHNLLNFPVGCCGYVSAYLQRYLYEQGIESLYVSGWEGDSHAWLVAYEDIIVDITGDQYQDNKGALFYDIPVYVGKEDEFHKLFKYNGPPISYPEQEINDSCSSHLKEMNNKNYNIILKYIQN